MVAIKSSEAEQFLANPPPHIFFFLVFGANAGLVSERARALVTGFGVSLQDPFQSTRLSGDDIASDPERLADEAHTIGLFGDKRLIWVSVGAKNITPACEVLFSSHPENCRIVVEAGALKKDAPLRKLAEQQKTAVAVECYPDDASSLLRMVDRETKAAGFDLQGPVGELLVSLMGDDRLAAKAELEKLLLYCHGRSEIGFDDILACIADATVMAMDDAVGAAFSGKIGSLDEILTRSFDTGMDAGTLLGQALRHAIVLHREKLESETGRSIEQALERTTWGPPQARREMATQAKNWTTGGLSRAIEILAEGVRRTRRDPSLAAPLAARALWSIAQAGRNQRR